MVENYLKRRITYDYLLVVILLLLLILYVGQGVLVQQSFVNVYSALVEVILAMIAAVCLLATRKTCGPAIEETPWGFGKGVLLGLSPLYILLNLGIPLGDPVEFVNMAIYFGSGAIVQELVFRYALPRFLFFQGYGFWRSIAISNLAFSMEHWFVWSMSPSTLLIGMAYGWAESLALMLNASFLGVSWSHAVYNIALAGACGAYLAIATLIVCVVVVARTIGRKR